MTDQELLVIPDFLNRLEEWKEKKMAKLTIGAACFKNVPGRRCLEQFCACDHDIPFGKAPGDDIEARLEEIDWDLWCIDSRYDGPIPEEEKRRMQALRDERRELLKRGDEG